MSKGRFYYIHLSFLYLVIFFSYFLCCVCECVSLHFHSFCVIFVNVTHQTFKYSAFSCKSNTKNNWFFFNWISDPNGTQWHSFKSPYILIVHVLFFVSVFFFLHTLTQFFGEQSPCERFFYDHTWFSMLGSEYTNFKWMINHFHWSCAVNGVLQLIDFIDKYVRLNANLLYIACFPFKFA